MLTLNITGKNLADHLELISYKKNVCPNFELIPIFEELCLDFV